MQRPVSVIVFGILNLLFAGFGVLGLLATLAMFGSMVGSANPVLDIMQKNPVYATWMKIMIPLGFLSCGVLLAAGIGLLRWKEWGRKASIGYSIYALVGALLGLVMNIIFVFRPLFETAFHQQGPEAVGGMIGAMAGTVGGVFGMIYPILLLVFMTRPKVVRAFGLPAN